MASTRNVSMEININTKIDLFGVVKTLVINDVSTTSNSIVSLTNYTFKFSSLDELPSSPKSG